MTGRGIGGKLLGKGGSKYRNGNPKCEQYFYSLWNSSDRAKTTIGFNRKVSAWIDS